MELHKPQLEYVMTVRLTLTSDPERRIILGKIPKGGERHFVGIVEGTFEGPKLRGKVLPHGGDWTHVWPNGVFNFDARYFLQTDDGTIIYLQNRGFRHATREITDRLTAGEYIDPSQYYMRVTPTFEVEEGPYDWLTKHIFIGIGKKTRDGDKFGNVVDYYMLL